MISVSEFRKVVDSVPNNISAIKEDLPELYAFFGLPSSSVFSLDAVLNEIYRIISASFATEHTLIWRHCKQLENELILEHVLTGEPLDPYVNVLERIRDATRRPIESRSAVDDWNTAISAAYDHVSLQSFGNGNDKHARLNPRQFSVAYAAHRLRERDFQLKLEEGRPLLEPESEAQLVKELEMLTKAIGGIRVVANILNLIRALYDSDQERYHLVRRVGTTGVRCNPIPPFGYLFSLAAKYPLLPKKVNKINRRWRELVNLSTDYATIFNVQPYTPYELMFQDSLSIIPFLREVALYDTLFGIQQIRPKDAIKITYGVLDWLDVKRNYDGDWSITEVLTIADNVLRIGRSQHEPLIFNARDLIRSCKGIRLNRIFKVLESVLSHPLPGANQAYAKPTDTQGPDFFMRPFLSFGHGDYCLLNPSACAPAVIEALFHPLRKAHPKFDENVGHAIERFLRRELEGKGVTVCGGKYKAIGHDGECDLIIETSDTVIFLEVKKKPLTRKARTGSNIDVLIDLAGSLLEAQLQAGWHEISLRQEGHINLIDQNGQCIYLSLNGRDVERIAVTLFDYGGFQDRVLLQQFFETTLGLRYSTDDVSTQKKINYLNTKVEELHNQVNQLTVLNPRRDRHPFFHCWFLSIPQLLVLLDSVTNNEDFKAALWNTRHAWGSSLDFYYEHAMIKKLKSI